MANFKTIRDPEIIDARYTDKLIVFVESEEDFNVMDRWFPEEAQWLEFISADEGVGGGCKQVFKKVEAFSLYFWNGGP